MLDQFDIEEINRLSKRKLSAEEKQYIYTLLSENEDSLKLKKYFFKKWDEYLREDNKKDYQLGFLLDRIHHIIHTAENRKKHSVANKIYKWYSAAAAILIPVIFVVSTLFIGEDLDIKTEGPVTSTLTAPQGARVSFSLPDGTEGWLNSGSSLEYSLPFNENRKINVLGEAWFDVAHDEAHPFEIFTGGFKVKVLGTKFNLCAYPEDKYIELVLEEGKVEFSGTGISSNLVMKPDERLVFSEGSVKIDHTESDKYSGWIEGKLIFKGDPMTEVAKRIKRWYNIDIEIADKELEKYVIRGTFQDDSLEEVIRYLSMTSPIDYQIIDRKILDDGTFQKKKVVLYKKGGI